MRTRHANAVPILMYHKVGHPLTNARDAFLNIPADAFRRQMQALARLGYQARTFAEVADAYAAGRSLPRRTCVVTFDDGYQCVGAAAAPILTEFGWPATVFVVSGCAGGTNAWDRRLGNPELALMDWDALKRLADAGWEIGGHTRTHPHLGALTDSEASQEIAGGKADAEARLGVPLHTFCYPFGHLNARTPELARRAGFRAACTTQSGLARATLDPFQQPRVKVYQPGVAALLYKVLIRPALPNRRIGG